MFVSTRVFFQFVDIDYYILLETVGEYVSIFFFYSLIFNRIRMF